jgi:hypothetical protein
MPIGEEIRICKNSVIARDAESSLSGEKLGGKKMASELISREALLAEYDRVHIGPPGGARKLMEEAPTVDAVEVVHGRWITHQEHDPDWWGYTDVHFCCSNCMKESNSRAYNYCPNCGAKMDKNENP